MTDTARNPVFTDLLTGILDNAYRTAHYLTGNREDAEELVQETALLAHRNFHRFELGTNFRAWFLTILRNRFVSEYRKKTRRIETVQMDDAESLYLYRKTRDTGLHDEAGDPARYLFDRLDRDKIQAALDRLPDEFREVSTLYFTQDLSYHEIARVLEIPVGTVRSRIHRGRRLLQRALWSVAEDYGLVTSAEGTP
jgi:RNA polymerase sigma-70 factor, ECF subfamily